MMAANMNWVLFLQYVQSIAWGLKYYKARSLCPSQKEESTAQPTPNTRRWCLKYELSFALTECM